MANAPIYLNGTRSGASAPAGPGPTETYPEPVSDRGVANEGLVTAAGAGAHYAPTPSPSSHPYQETGSFGVCTSAPHPGSMIGSPAADTRAVITANLAHANGPSINFDGWFGPANDNDEVYLDRSEPLTTETEGFGPTDDQEQS